jgi:hypothetical protein
VALGKTEEALAEVEAAAKNGYRELFDMESDSDLAPLVGLPRFSRVFEEARRGAPCRRIRSADR